MQHANQGDSREVVSLGHHLCAHQHINLSVPKAIENTAMGRARAGGVRIHPINPKAWPQSQHPFFETLGPVPDQLQSAAVVA